MNFCSEREWVVELKSYMNIANWLQNKAINILKTGIQKKFMFIPCSEQSWPEATNGVQHVRRAPYHPATNGMAERFVQTFKQAL